MTMQEMMETYNRFAGAHKYLLGFVVEKKVYYVTLSFNQLATYFKMDRMSSKKGGYAKIRIRMTAAQRREMMASATLLGDSSLLEADTNYNRGDNFEKIIVETLEGKAWKKNSDPFNRGGDTRLNGEEIQVKLDSAELTNERCLSKLLAAA